MTPTRPRVLRSSRSILTSQIREKRDGRKSARAHPVSIAFHRCAVALAGEIRTVTRMKHVELSDEAYAALQRLAAALYIGVNR